jgi:hypothetical protein
MDKILTLVFRSRISDSGGTSARLGNGKVQKYRPIDTSQKDENF